MLRRAAWFIAFLVGLTACASEEVVDPPTRAQVVDAYVATGLSEDVASCVVGMGERQFGLVDLDPARSTPPATQVLVDEFILSCVNASQMGSTSVVGPPSLAFSSEPDQFGDDAGLDDLWLLCEAGAGSSCDELWETAPVGSGYEKFGVTCGERFEVLDCSQELPLDPSEIDLEELRPVTEGEAEEDEADAEEDPPVVELG